MAPTLSAPQPLTWQVTRSHVRVFRGGRLVKDVGGAAGTKLAVQLEAAGAGAAKRLLARATGNYRRGNERQPISRS